MKINDPAQDKQLEIRGRIIALSVEWVSWCSKHKCARTNEVHSSLSQFLISLGIGGLLTVHDPDHVPGMVEEIRIQATDLWDAMDEAGL